MFGWNLAEKIFDGFTILRWTDMIRPIEYVEMDKHALNSVLTYLIGKEYEHKTGRTLNWCEMVTYNIVSYLANIATSDIKAPIRSFIQKESRAEWFKYILDTYYSDDAVKKYRLNTYISRQEFENGLKFSENDSFESRIFEFAHKFVTYSEFKQIIKLNDTIPDKDEVENSIRTTLTNMIDRKQDELRDILNNLYNDTDDAFVRTYKYFEKLRPQTRWAQTCRMPSTSVLGHSMFTAVLTYLTVKSIAIEEPLANDYLVNNFFAALFHDLPESLTRDIISPIKNNIENMKSLLSRYEYKIVKEKILDRLDPKWAEEFKQLLGVKEVNTETEGTTIYGFEPFDDRTDNPPYICGKLIKVMDLIAAFMEAKKSVDVGVTSMELQKGIKSTQTKLLEYEPIKYEKAAKTLYVNSFLATIPHYAISEISEADKDDKKNKSVSGGTAV